MKLFITGATGYIGRNLIRSLTEKDYDCTAYVRPASDLTILKETNCRFFYESDICGLIEHFGKERYDGIIHLAALYIHSHKPEETGKLINSNILLGTNLLEAAVKTGVKWFLNTGTFMQHYENNEYSPVNLYAATKQAFEDIAKFYSEAFNLCFTTLKLNDSYGPNDPRPKIFNLWKKIAESGKSMDMSPGEQIIDIVYIDDIINAYNIIINRLNSDPKQFDGKSYVVTADKKLTLKELASIYETQSNTKLNINWNKLPYRNREVMVPFTGGTKPEGWKPEIDIEQGIKLLLKDSNNVNS